MSETKSSWPKEEGNGQSPLEVAIDAKADEGEDAIKLWESLYEIPFVCPSGAHVTLTPPTLLTFIHARRMTRELAGEVDKKKKGKQQPAVEMTEEAAAENILYAQRVCETVMLRPRCVAPDDEGNVRPLKKGEMDGRRIPHIDLLAIANWAVKYNAEHGVGGGNGKAVTSADAKNFRDDARLPVDVARVPGVQAESGGATSDQESAHGN